MVQIFSSSPYSGGGAPPPKPGETDKDTPSVPPPPPASMQVDIRTMGSDLERMGRSLEEALQSIDSSGTSSILGRPKPAMPANRPKFVLWGTVVATGVVVFFFIGYFLLPFFFAAEETELPVEPAAISSPTSTTPVAVFLGHKSFLRRSADYSANLRFQSTVNPSYYSLYLNDLRATLGQPPGEGDFTEIALEKDDDQALAWVQMLGLLGMSAVEEDFWLNRFEQDFTFFAYSQAGAWHLGYILKLKPGQSPLILQPAVLKIESDPNLKNFFLDAPGDAQGDFRDSQISGQPVRIQNWSSFGSAFVYGWLYNQYLVVSTSEGGFREAMLRL